MAKKFPPGPCIHCLLHVEKPTSDHVFPKSWYPDSTPPNVERWQAPSCEDCNRRYGRLEEALLEKFSLCLDDNALASLGLGSRLVKALDPTRGRDEKDTRIRESRARKLLEGQHVPAGDRPIVNMTGTSSGLAISLDVRDLEKIGEKIMRGMIHMHLNVTVGDEFDLFCNALPKAEATFDAIFQKSGTVHEVGPGIRVSWIKPTDGPLGGVFRIVLFGQYVLRGGVLPKDYRPPVAVACTN